MNIRFTILLVVILVVIGGTVWITQRDSADDSEERKPWLWKIELEDIQRIDITHSDTSISYKRDGRTWVIEDGNDTPVYQPKWGGKALIVSGPKPARILDETIEDPTLYGLDPVATRVEVTDRSGQIVMFELGAVTPDGNNQYVRLNDGSLSTLPKIWGEVVVSLATAPPYSPPFIALLGNDEVREIKILVRDETGNIEAEVVYLLTGLSGEGEGVPEEWILVEGNGVLVQEDRWAELTSGLADAGLLIETETFDDLPDLESKDWTIRLDMRSRDNNELAYFVYGEASDPARRYLWLSGDDTLSTVDASWADLLATLAEDPAVADAPPTESGS